MKVSAPKEDPELQAAQDAESTRANAALVGNTQDLLNEEDRKRLRLLGSPTGTTGTGGFSTGSVPLTSGGAGIPAFTGGLGGGGGISGGGGGRIAQA